MAVMRAETTAIADKVRGVTGEKRVSQEQVAEILGLSRQSVSQRYTGRVPFAGCELFTLALSLDVDIRRFFPEPHPLTTPASAPPSAGAGVSSSVEDAA